MSPIVVLALLNKKIKDTNKRIDDMGSGMSYCGSVPTVNDLPDDADIGDTYTVTGEGNAMFLWDGTEWIEQNAGLFDSVAAIIALTYDSTATYGVGDYAIYQKKLYRCTTAIATPEDFTAAHWTETKVATEIKSLSDGKISLTEKGAANGVATLDANTKIPEAQIPDKFDNTIPCYYDDGKIYSDSSHQTEITPATGKLYYTQDTHIIYYYSGNNFIKVGSGLSLGETSSDAYRGDDGKKAYDDSQSNKEHIGNLENLTTTANQNLVAAINENDADIGDLTNLDTTAKTNLVAAINEVAADATNADIDALFT